MNAAHTIEPELAGLVRKSTFRDTPRTRQMGKVYLIGAGPGAADLITVRGARLLSMADVVVHDSLVEPAMLDYAPRAHKIAVGKRCGRRSTAQQFINKQIVDAASEH